MSAASPGVVSLFFRNDHYKDHETYLLRHRRRDAPRIRDSGRAGIVLQIDCPDLAMGRHIQYRELDLAEFRKRARDARRGAEPCARQYPARAAPHAPVLGQLRGPAPLRRAARRHRRHRVSCPADRRSRFEAANPRHAHEWNLFETVKLPDGKVLIPGVHRIEVEFHRASRADRATHWPLRQGWSGRENVIAGSDCGYGTWVGQAAVDPDVVWAKFRAMAEGAKIASREFWSNRD